MKAASIALVAVLGACAATDQLAESEYNIAAPSGVSATALSDSRIQVSWTPVPDAFKYYVYRAEGAGSFEYVDTALAPSTTSLSINLSASTAYTFKIAAEHTDSTVSELSDTASATTYGVGQNAVATPSNVAASPVSESRIQLTWDPVPNAFKYYVYRGEGGGSLTYVDTVLAPSTTSLSVNLTPNTSYSFAVGTVLTDGTESSGMSAPVSASTYQVGLNNVPTPNNVVATPVSESRVQISWDPIPGAFKYYVFRAEGGGPFVYVDTQLAPSTTSLSIGLSPSTQYSFAVGTAMEDGSESSGQSAPVAVTTYAVGLNNVPTADHVVATPVSESRIRISWDPIPGAFKYYVFRAEGGGPLVYVDTVLAPSTSSLSIGLSASTQYSFAIGTAMQDGTESSGKSAPVAATTYGVGLNDVPTPNNVAASAVSESRIQLTWDAIPGAFKYYIYRAEGAGSFVYVDTVLAPSTTALSINLQPNTQYSFKVGTAMEDGTESSGQSAPVSATTYGVGLNNVATPGGVQATAVAPTRINVSWNAVPGAAKYYVYRAEGGGPAVFVASVLAPATSYTAAWLTPGTEYAFSIATSMQDGSESVGASAPVAATTPATPVPTNVTASPLSETEISLSWDATPDAFKYYVFRATADGDAELVDVVVGGTAHTSTGLTSATAYHYTVVAALSDGTETAASSIASATTF